MWWGRTFFFFFRGFFWRPCAETLPPSVGIDTRNSLTSKRFFRAFLSRFIDFLKSIFEEFSPKTDTHTLYPLLPFPVPRTSVEQSSKISHIQSPWLVCVLGAPITHYPLLSRMNLYIAHLEKKNIYVKCGHPQDI